jgi:competence protein ComEA
MWSQPDSVGMRIQTEEAALIEDLFPLNLNIATQQEIELIPSIGPGRASSIIAFRQENGSFGAVEDLLKIKGIGPATLEKLRPFVTVSEEE